MSFWVCLAVVKIIHEFGHGLTAKHFGGEVHEMGILFLVLTPALYCDVTDSWLLPNKWKRIWISAAGIYVECFLASIATFVWWYSTPGLLNSLAMATMFICSVNTIMFNANPLLRYDGYYVMADWLEIPNLRIKSTQFFAYLIPGEGAGPGDPRPELHAAVAAVPVRDLRGRQLHLSLVRHVRDPLVPVAGLEAVQARVGQLPAGSRCSLVPLLGMPVYQIGKFLRTPGRLRKVKKARAAAFRRGGDRARRGILLIPTPLRIDGNAGAQAGQARRGLRRGRRPAGRAERQGRRLGHERHGARQAVQPRPRKRSWSQRQQDHDVSLAQGPLVPPEPRARESRPGQAARRIRREARSR